jgi:hypothetical protein
MLALLYFMYPSLFAAVFSRNSKRCEGPTQGQALVRWPSNARGRLCHYPQFGTPWKVPALLPELLTGEWKRSQSSFRISTP